MGRIVVGYKVRVRAKNKSLEVGAHTNLGAWK